MIGRNRSSLEMARAQAVLEAERKHRRLHTNLSKRIDIFDIIERDNLWLMFQPLRNLYGSYLPVEGSLGILINANHPLNLQRYTASHEYGHFVLGHEVSLDEAESIQPRGSERNLQEAAAQSFAAYFLMPLQLVNTVLRSMGLPLKPESLTPAEAYHFSLEVGVSYSAAVNHLATLNKIPWRVANELRGQEPKIIKAEIGLGTRPQDVRADVWRLDEHDSGRIFHIRVNDELHILLPEAPSTGYIWTVDETTIADLRRGASEDESASGAFLALVDERFQPATRSGELRLGAGGLRRFVFQSIKPGKHTLQLVNRRPWRANTEGLKTFEIFLDISSNNTHGLRERQQKSLLLVGA